MGSYLWLLGIYFVTGFDFSAYTVKDWLQILAAVLGIVGSTFGAWKAFRYSKGQIAKRLLEYLNDHEKNIENVRQVVVPHFRNGQPINRNPDVKIHECLESAIKLAARGQDKDAEQKLYAFVVFLRETAQVGKRHMDIAKSQAATVLVCRGLIAHKRGEIDTAHNAWTQALEENPQDADAIRCLGELDLAAGRSKEALQQFDRAVALAGPDKLLRAEASGLKAGIFRQRDNPRLELAALHDCAPNFEEVGEHGRAGEAYERAGELESELGRKRTPLSLRKAHTCYFMAQDRAGTARIRARLSALGEDVSALPVLDGRQFWELIPWSWVRLSLEVLILGAACYVTFMR